MTLSENPDRDELKDHYDESDDSPTDCWDNYGDANPDVHGGDWLTYDSERGSFELRGTFLAIEMGFDIPEDEETEHQYVYYNECYFSDIVAEDGSFTESALSTAESLSLNQGPAGLIVDNSFTWFVAAYLDERRHSYSRGPKESVYTGDYAEILDRVGVEPCDGEL